MRPEVLYLLLAPGGADVGGPMYLLRLARLSRRLTETPLLNRGLSTLPRP